jgi:hypothetical protein
VIAQGFYTGDKYGALSLTGQALIASLYCTAPWITRLGKDANIWFPQDNNSYSTSSKLICLGKGWLNCFSSYFNICFDK